MNADEVIDSYVRDVASYLPRSKRNDVAFELRSLLADELAAKSRSAGRQPDKALALEILSSFGRPAVVAGRYHHRSALIEPADTHHFLIWSLAGFVTISLHDALNQAAQFDAGDAALKWLGILLVFYALMGWWRRRTPNSLHWKPGRGPEWMPRWLALLCLALTLLFPVFMYFAPQTFVRVIFFGAITDSGLELTELFRYSWQRIATMTALAALPALYACVAFQGALRRWAGWAFAASHFSLGLLLIGHGAPLTAFRTGAAFSVFVSQKANDVSGPIFVATGGCLILCALYQAYVEWARIIPAPAHTPPLAVQ